MMFGKFLGLAALLYASLAVGSSATADAPREFRVSTAPVVMDHVTIETSTPYQLVTSRLDDEVKRFDESYRQLLHDNQIDELRVKLTQGLEPDGFMIHFVAEQGHLLALEGRRQQGNVYYLGNVLAAAQMTKPNFSAALYAPCGSMYTKTRRVERPSNTISPQRSSGSSTMPISTRLLKASMTTCSV
jgi:hypothetical protein